MSLTYVIPDIHGRHDLLSEALAEISLRSGGEAGAIVTIGDYIDKGPDSKRVIDRLLAGVDAGWRLVTLKGNHDALMSEALRDPLKMAGWMGKGGDAALASYGGDPAAVPASHIDWLDRLQLLHVDAHRVYVHAGVDPELPLDQQSEATLLCKRYPNECSDGFGTLHVVHGHDNHPEGPLLYEGRTNLDTLAWRTGRLIVGVFDDDRPGGPTDLIEVRGRPAEREGGRAGAAMGCHFQVVDAPLAFRWRCPWRNPRGKAIWRCVRPLGRRFEMIVVLIFNAPATRTKRRSVSVMRSSRFLFSRLFALISD